jgi:SPP1 gp7 family putative phage head morphogenesis protein
MTETAHPVLSAAATYRQELLRNEDAAIRRLVAAYGTAYQRLGTQIQALREILTDEPMTRRRAMQLAQLVALRQQVVEELARFGVIADNELSQLTRQSVDLALNHSAGLIQSHFASPQARQAVMASLINLSPDQINTILGFTAENSPLRQSLIEQLGPAVAERVSERLVDGMIRGFNPNKTAQIVRTEMGVGLSWTINTVRTANLYSYRETTRSNYVANSRVVSGWRWYATLDRRVCGSCLSKHGTLHELTETLNGHHQCRCSMIPELPMAKSLGLDLPETEPGESWFGRQDEGTQSAILGPGMLAAWRDGAVQFEQFSRPYHNDVYGTMLRMASMRELNLQEYYQR